jgi:DNA mismatch endonuclease, patch repair protein
MKRQRRRDTAPELAIRRILHAHGLRFFVDRRVLPEVRTKADIVFPRSQVAVFIDGCFWHRCPDHGTTPKSNQAWWVDKFATTVARDHRVDGLLRSSGWRVIRVWEHADAELAAHLISTSVRETTAKASESLEEGPVLQR